MPTPVPEHTTQGKVPWGNHLRLIAHTAADHWATDPVVFAMQLSRRLPDSATRWAARPISYAAPVLPGIGALGLHMTGAEEKLERVFDQAARKNTSEEGNDKKFRNKLAAINRAHRLRVNRRLSEVALAADALDHAFRLTAELPDDFPSAAGTRARRDWYVGDMTSAVKGLQKAWLTGSATSGEKKQLIRYADERALLHGSTLDLGAVLGDDLHTLAATYRPRPHTVLHVLTNSVPHTHSGYALRSHFLLQAQVKLGWDVHAITRAGYPVQVGKLNAPSRHVIDGVTYHRINPPRLPMTSTGRLNFFAQELLVRCLLTRPEVLHTTTHFVNAVVVKEVARILDIPWVYEVRGQLADTWTSRRPPVAQRSERYRYFTNREAQATIEADDTAALGGVLAQRVQEITAGQVQVGDIRLAPNAVGPDYEDEPEEVFAVRARLNPKMWGLDPDGFWVGTVSSVVDYEGLDDLIHAMVTLPKHMSAVIVGDGAAKAGLQELAKTLGVDHRVVFVGRVDQQQARMWQRALDVFVVPRRDRLVTQTVAPLKIVEAFASQVPVIASDLPAIAETVVHNVTGILIEPENPHDLAQAIHTLWESYELRTRLAQAGRQSVMEHRTWSAVAMSTIAQYKQIMRHRHRDSPQTNSDRRTA